MASPSSTSSSDPEDSAGSGGDGDESEVDFWGGESPRLLSLSPPSRAADETAVDDSSESESDEDDDDNDDGDDDYDDDDEFEIDGSVEGTPGLLDQLDIPGHR